MRSIITVTMCFAALALVVTTSVSADAQTDTLRGISEVAVHVPDFGPEVNSAGITRDTIRQDVELKLRKCGIRIVSLDEAKGNPDAALVAATLELVPQHDVAQGLFAVHVSVSVLQFASLARDPKHFVAAQTWISKTQTTTLGERKLATARDLLADRVDEFANAFLEANPKK